MRTQVCLIQVPYMAGDNRHGAAKGPESFIQTAAVLLRKKGIGFTVESVNPGIPFRDSVNTSLLVCKELASIVRRTAESGKFPLILAGSCDVSKGILAGLEQGRMGIVWLDAHGDFNTPETTITGFFPGMSLAIITGHCYGDYRARLGNNSPIPEEATLLLGVRDLDPAERHRLETSAIEVVHWHDGKPDANVAGRINDLSRRVTDIYLHIDMDALDSHVAPGVTDAPVPGGLSLSDMEEVIRLIASRLRIKAAALATYNPDRDHDDKSLNAGVRIIELLSVIVSDQLYAPKFRKKQAKAE
jgi:arginase